MAASLRIRQGWVAGFHYSMSGRARSTKVWMLHLLCAAVIRRHPAARTTVTMATSNALLCCAFGVLIA